MAVGALERERTNVKLVRWEPLAPWGRLRGRKRDEAAAKAERVGKGGTKNLDRESWLPCKKVVHFNRSNPEVPNEVEKEKEVGNVT